MTSLIIFFRFVLKYALQGSPYISYSERAVKPVAKSSQVMVFQSSSPIRGFQSECLKNSRIIMCLNFGLLNICLIMVGAPYQITQVCRYLCAPRDRPAHVRHAHRRGVEGDRDPHLRREEEVAPARQGNQEEAGLSLNSFFVKLGPYKTDLPISDILGNYQDANYS